MSPTIKRILLILGLLIVAGLIAYGLYIMFVKTGQGPLTPFGQKTTITTGTLPTASTRTTTAEGVETTTAAILPSAGFNIQSSTAVGYYQPKSIEQITSDYAIYTSIDNTGNYRYHNATDGKFYKVGADGKISPLSDEVFYNVDKVTWAKTKDTAVIEYPDSSKIIYNFSTNKQVSLPKHWEDFSFSPDGKEIAAKSVGLAKENRWLVTTQDDGAGTKVLEPLGNNQDKVIVDWSPSRQVVGFSQTGAALGADRVQMLMVGLNGENFKALTLEGRGFQPQWSPTGKNLLYSVYSARSNYNPELWITSAYGDSIDNNRQSLKLNTWANKCAFGGDESTLYCAVPTSLPQGAGMIPSVANNISDELYKIDLKTGLKTSLKLDSGYNVNSISYDITNDKLYFTDTNRSGVFQFNFK